MVLSKIKLNKELLCAGIFSVMTATVLLLICSKNSPLYLINDWTDVSVMFTNGRRMLKGQVLYKDFYEHKGLYYCFLFELSAFINSHMFIGVYLIEVISISVFLFFSYRTWRLFYEEIRYIYIIFFGALFISSKPFIKGGSAEELVLPFMMIALYILLKNLHEDKTLEDISKKSWLLMGVFTGIIFWIKYTLCIYFVGICIYIGIYMCMKKNFFELVKISFLWFLGMVISSIPAVVYFTVNNAWTDLIHVYGYNLIFAYDVKSGSGGVVLIIIMLIVYPIFLISGIIALKKKIFNKKENALLILLFFTNCSYYIFISLKCNYVLLIFMELFATWFLGIISILDRYYKKYMEGKVRQVMVITIVLLGTYIMSPNTEDIGKSREHYVFYRYADIIKKESDATLLVYDAYEEGFYFASDIIPDYKYITDYNIKLDEIKEDIEGIVSRKDATFVITVNEKPDEVSLNYNLLNKEKYKSENEVKAYYLWKRK